MLQLWSVSVEVDRILAVCCALQLVKRPLLSVVVPVAETKWVCFCFKMFSEMCLNHLNDTQRHLTCSMTWNSE